MNDLDLGMALAPRATDADRARILAALTPSRRIAYERLVLTAEALGAGAPLRDALAALAGHVLSFTPVGSRVTCEPAPVGTDEDWLILLADRKVAKGRIEVDDPEPFDRLASAGFTQDGSPEFYTGSDAGGFRSWRRGDVNLVTTRSPEFHARFLTATHLAKRFNLLDKTDRIALFQAVLYGVDADRLESPRSAARAA